MKIRFLGDPQIDIGGKTIGVTRTDESWQTLLFLLIDSPGLTQMEYAARVDPNTHRTNFNHVVTRLREQLGSEEWRLSVEPGQYGVVRFDSAEADVDFTQFRPFYRVSKNSPW